MQRGTTYTNERLGKLEIVPDFLPPPEDLVLKDEGVRVTVSLTKRSVEFFKAHASRANVSYRKMIGNLLEAYADRYSEKPAKPAGGGRRSTRASRRP